MDWSRFQQARLSGSLDPWHDAMYHGGKGSAPPAPDYKGAAQAQGQANVDAAIATAKLSNPNIINPYGSQTVTYGSGNTFDQSGYDKALKAYQTGLASGGGGGTQLSGIEGITGKLPQQMAQYFGGAQSGGVAGAPPDPSKYWRTGGDPLVPTVTQSLSPEGQQRFDQNNRIDTGLGDIAEQGLGYVKNQLDTPFDQSTLPQRSLNAGQTGQDAIMARLQPNLERQREQMRTQLYNSGAREGSEAYQNAMTDQNQRENDLYTNAALQGISLGDQARNSAIQEQSFFRNEPLNMLNAVRSASPVNIPQFQGYQGANVQAAPMMQGAMAQGQADMNRYGLEQAGNNAFMSGLFSLGSSYLGRK